jgi:hypothetical protein
MQGDFSRWTFDARARYRSVLLQQGRVLLDADWNEQVEITAHHDETRARDTFGRSGVPLEVWDSFKITDKAGAAPKDTSWEDLRITSGRMYVDGVLIEAHEKAGGIPLEDQPDLPAIGENNPGLAEPDEDGRYALYLSVRTHHVTADEAPELREPALGGPDTTTRTRTVWQVRWARAYNANTTCSDLHVPGWKVPDQGTMTATLKGGTLGDDPCALTAEARYTRLENQLYRVQIHKTGEKFLWSRENGSVTAALRGISTTGLPEGVNAVLTVDREGRDASLSIEDGSIVEITSTTRQLRGTPGYLAKAVKPEGRRIPVTWIEGAGVTNLSALGTAPVVRRWESEPVPVADTPTDLEGGICVQFSKPFSDLRTGDYWLVAARSARLAYGLAAEAGTLLPVGLDAAGTARKPHGPQVHATPLAILERKTTGGVAKWTRESDCRRVAPSLTRLTTLDLVGGDGQETLPGGELPGAIRVVVRNGEVPVPAAPVLFTPKGGTIRQVGAATPHPADKPVFTDPWGVASVWWTPDAAGAGSQTLEAQRLNSAGQGTDVKVVVTGRMSKAADVGWTPPADCTGFSNSQTVQAALEWLVQLRELRLLGGDGQYLPTEEKVLPQRIRVLLDSPCGPVKGVKVRATASPGALVKRAVPNEPRPTSLDGGVTSDLAETEPDGGAAFWWQPKFTGATTDTLTVSQEVGTSRAPIVVTAQPGVSFKHREGMHITDLYFEGKPATPGSPEIPQIKFTNDSPVDVPSLKRGITVVLDREVNGSSLQHAHSTKTGVEVFYKPVVRVVLQVPFPEYTDKRYGYDPLTRYAFQSVTLGAVLTAKENKITWKPDKNAVKWMDDYLFDYTFENKMVGRFEIDGWAILSKTGNLQLNTHVTASIVQDEIWRRTDYGTPTGDAVTAGRFEQWFWLSYIYHGF